MNKFHILIVFLISIGIHACGVYSFTGAEIEGKTINVHFIENKAATIAPSLSATFTEKLRQHILSLSSLSMLNNDNADYKMSGYFTQYNVTVAAIGDLESSARNRLTITVHIEFENKKDTKKSFEQDFTRFADFESSQNFQTVEKALIEQISDQLKDDIFNKAFVNW